MSGRLAKVVDLMVLIGGQQLAANVAFNAESYLSDAEWIQISDTMTANLHTRQRISTVHVLSPIASTVAFVATTLSVRYFVD